MTANNQASPSFPKAVLPSVPTKGFSWEANDIQDASQTVQASPQVAVASHHAGAKALNKIKKDSKVCYP
jgi:hypothetical protein